MGREPLPGSVGGGHRPTRPPTVAVAEPLTSALRPQVGALPGWSV